MEEPDFSRPPKSNYLDDIFSRDRNKLVAFFEDLLAEHTIDSCTRFERAVRVAQVRRDMERGSRDESGHMIRRDRNCLSQPPPESQQPSLRPT